MCLHFREGGREGGREGEREGRGEGGRKGEREGREGERGREGGRDDRPESLFCPGGLGGSDEGRNAASTDVVYLMGRGEGV